MIVYILQGNNPADTIRASITAIKGEELHRLILAVRNPAQTHTPLLVTVGSVSYLKAFLKDWASRNHYAVYQK